jgi:hypothetical protein
MPIQEKEKTEIVFEIVNHVGVIASYASGWKKESNVVSWNNSTPKYDIRDWDPEHKHISRGITLHEEELKTLASLI